MWPPKPIIIRPFKFTKEALLYRLYSWLGEWLDLVAVVINILTLGYLEVTWKFTWQTYVRFKWNSNV